MKRTISWTLLATALSIFQAQAAGDVNYTVNLSANIGDICTFPDTPTVSEGADYFGTLSTSSTTFTPETDTSGIAQSVIGELKFAGAVCTRSTTLTFDSSNFALQGPATPGFATEILYSVSLNWDDKVLVPASTPGQPVNVANQTVDATTGDLVLRIVTEAGTAPLNTGNYTGAINLILTST